MKKFALILVFTLTAAWTFTSCNKAENTTDKQESVEFDEFEEASSEETFYRIPSPDEMFSFLNDKELKYQPELLNPSANADNYIDRKSKELNFGVYAADLAYTASFHQFQGSVDYINIVKRLAEDIEISAVFNEDMNKRIKNIFENADTLVNVTNATYYQIVNYLQKSDRNQTLSLLTAGGWIETLYVVIHIIPEYDENSATVQHIADQKLTFENLMLSLEQFQEDPAIKETIDDFKEIGKIYAQLKVVNAETSTKQNQEGNVVIVGSKSKLHITKEQFNQLKQKIAEVRNKITGNTNV
ncbi:MAG: hypothetical protein KAI79_07055 [Bacteroidales bacterium]|nr:hypothetical protein [Bacteroidales bacterium]